MNEKHSIDIIAGPTASGKSALALQRAADTNGVIINCDSMQIYEDLPILAAQPSDQDKQAAPHKLYGLLKADQPCSAGHWRKLAIPLIEQAIEEGKRPIICGGTGLYIKALTDGLSPMPEVPAEIRKAAMDKLNAIGSAALNEELTARDPQMKDRFHPNHSARIVRAWEVLEATGKSLAHWQSLPLMPPPANWNFNITIVLPDRETLYARCNQRFHQMLEIGALDEVKAFKRRCENGEIPEKALIRNALGFKPLCRYLNGETTLDEAIEKSQQNTRNYAKRQTTWFKNQFDENQRVVL